MDNKILVAEDEEKIRRLVSSYLVREGFKVVEAADGQQAVEKFEDNEDVVLVMLDVMMPKKDGYDACREIRGKSNEPILMLTARDSEQDEVAGFGAGADGKKIITTPKEFDLLYYLIRNTNIVLTRDQIICTVWDMDYAGDDRTVDTHIKCLRAKLGPYAKCIVTVRKVGYKFEWLE